MPLEISTRKVGKACKAWYDALKGEENFGKISIDGRLVSLIQKDCHVPNKMKVYIIVIDFVRDSRSRRMIKTATKFLELLIKKCFSCQKRHSARLQQEGP